MKNYSNTNYCLLIIKMSALLFPGQGSQAIGMGLEFHNNFSSVKKFFQEADDTLKFPISKIIQEGPDEKLQLTENTQPAILTVSYSIFKILKNEFGFNSSKFNYFAGHSLGEYSALVCSDSLDFKDALYLLHERGKAMQNAVPVGKGKMIAILGTPIDEISNYLKNFENENICEIANDNSVGQVIVSGEKSSVDKFELYLQEKKLKQYH